MDDQYSIPVFVLILVRGRHEPINLFDSNDVVKTGGGLRRRHYTCKPNSPFFGPYESR